MELKRNRWLFDVLKYSPQKLEMFNKRKLGDNDKVAY